MLALVAEFFGTLILMLIGEGVDAMTTLFGKGVPGEIVNGGYTDITIAWGIAVTLGIYVSNRYSGAHLNPAVTLSLAVFRGFSWRKVLPYMLAQFLGAFCAGGAGLLELPSGVPGVRPWPGENSKYFLHFPRVRRGAHGGPFRSDPGHGNSDVRHSIDRRSDGG